MKAVIRKRRKTAERLGRCLQAGVLLGLGLAFMGSDRPEARAGGGCPGSEACAFEKPNLLILLDASSSMGLDYTESQTRWQAAVDGIDTMVSGDNGFFSESTHIAVMRFGHDPDPSTAGTPLEDLIDGVSLDVGWYDPALDPEGYFECVGDDLGPTLAGLTPPTCDGPGCDDVGRWLAGSLDAAHAYIQQTRADHPGDEERLSVVLVVTDGPWTAADGTEPAGDPFEHPDNPVPVAATLFGDDIPVYVAALADAAADPAIDDVANAGGTLLALDIEPGELDAGLQLISEEIVDITVGAECSVRAPRIMVLLDGSSSMLNVSGADGVDVAGAMGETPWDHARQALAGTSSFLQSDVPSTGVERRLEDFAWVGLATYGSVGEARILADYGTCTRERFEWALDPQTSCGGGCADPWGGPPIIWSPQGPGTPEYPDFETPTYSAMPECQLGLGAFDACSGSNDALHEGLVLVRDNAALLGAPGPQPPSSWLNILITDGGYRDVGGSTDEQVSAALSDMHTNLGITTYVIGFGPDADSEAADLACWGSGGTGIPCSGGALEAWSASDATELDAALLDIVGQLSIDPCCGLNQCTVAERPGGSTGGGSTTTDGAHESSSGDASSSSGEPEPPVPDPSSTSGSEETGTEPPPPGTTSANTTTTDPGPSSTGHADTDAEPEAVSATDGCGCTSPDTPPGSAAVWLIALLGLRRRLNHGTG